LLYLHWVLFPALCGCLSPDNTCDHPVVAAKIVTFSGPESLFFLLVTQTTIRFCARLQPIRGDFPSLKENRLPQTALLASCPPFFFLHKSPTTFLAPYKFPGILATYPVAVVEGFLFLMFVSSPLTSPSPLSLPELCKETIAIKAVSYNPPPKGEHKHTENPDPSARGRPFPRFPHGEDSPASFREIPLPRFRLAYFASDD